MPANADDPLLSAAGRISDGVAVDWSHLQALLATADQSAVAEELRAIEHVARAHDAVPGTWGRFAIVGEIGRGSFGTVYRAIDPTLRLEIALKVIAPPRPGDPFDAERALEEVRRIVKVRHQHVVRAYGAERIGNEVALSMELVRGHTLDDLVREHGPFGPGEAAVIGLELCQALAAVHGAGLLHGDVKAHNVMREDGGRTVLMDFGTGRELRKAPDDAGSDFAGTPLYLAPEVFAGGSRTRASDIYSLGVLLYFLVTAAFPVDGENGEEIRERLQHPESRRALRDVRPDLPDGFVRVVERAIAADPLDRFPTAGAMEAALARSLGHDAGEPRRESNRRRLAQVAAAIAVVLAVPALLAYLMVRPSAPIPVDAAATAGAGTAAADSATLPAGAYRVSAAFFREQGGALERLQPGARIAPGDKLSFQIQVSAPAYVYVVNEDEKGESYLLFPLPGQSLPNPLPAGRPHRLPGTRDGELIAWQVTSAGGREHFLVMASPRPSPEFEAIFATLPQPAFGRPVLAEPLSAGGRSVLRGVGGLTASSIPVNQQLRLLPEFSTPLGAAEEVAEGVWIRQVTFENPEEVP